MTTKHPPLSGALDRRVDTGPPSVLDANGQAPAHLADADMPKVLTSDEA